MKVQPDDIIIRTLPQAEKKTSKKSRFSRIGAGVAAMAIASVSLLTGFAFTPTGSAATAAFAEEDNNPWNQFWGGVADTFNPCMNPKSDELPGIREYQGDTSNLGPNSDFYTAYEWYGGATTNSWENYTWKEVGGGCFLTLQGFNVIPNLMLSTQNNLATSIVIPSVSWISGVNLIDLFFLNPDSVVQKMVQQLNRVFYSEYLLVIIALSAISLIWVGLVKKRYRDSLGDLIWVIVATAAGTIFLANPTLVAGWMDKGVYAVQNTIISSATAAGLAATGESSENSRCQVTNGAADYPVSPPVRTMQCSLWDSFVFQPWAEGQMGRAATNGLTVEGAQATFRGSNEAALLLLDVRTYNRLDVESGATTGSNKSALDDRKQDQWDALGNTIINSDAAEVGYPYWTGEAWVERITIATGAFAAKLFAFVPVVWLSFGMLGQQIIFVLLMMVAPFFLLAGIFPQARRFALGWVEMVLSTAVKRIVYAVLIGLLFLWFAAVSSVTIPSGLLGTIVGVNVEVLLMAIGAVVIMVIQRKAIKRAGDAIRLGGERVTDGGRTREFFNMTGNAVASGLGAKSAGGSFSEGFGNKFSVPGVSNNPVVNSFTNANRRVAARTKLAEQRKQAKGSTSITDELFDSQQATEPAGSTTPASGSSPRPAARPAGKGQTANSDVSIAVTTGGATTAGAGDKAASGSASGNTPRPSRAGSTNAQPADIAAQVTDLQATTPVETTGPSRPRPAEQLKRSSEQNIQAAKDAEAPQETGTTNQPRRPQKQETQATVSAEVTNAALAPSTGSDKEATSTQSTTPRRPSRPNTPGE